MKKSIWIFVLVPAAIAATAESVVADEAYVRESILNPRAKVTAGFRAVMPTFQGQISEEQLLQLLAYIKSLSPADGAAANTNRRPAE
jgi:cytochrome c oxidase subunit 2